MAMGRIPEPDWLWDLMEDDMPSRKAKVLTDPQVVDDLLQLVDNKAGLLMLARKYKEETGSGMKQAHEKIVERLKELKGN